MSTCKLLKSSIVALILVAGPNFSYATDKYIVNKDGGNLIVMFYEQEYVRFHTSPNHAPYIEKSYNPNPTKIVVKPNQWLEMKLDNGIWSFMSDADNR